jgi:RNA polymerase sigma factor (sigma-70 family)
VKRGGRIQLVDLEEGQTAPEKQAAELVALDDVLTNLAAVDSRKAKVVEMRYLGGMSVEETAEALEISPVTVMRRKPRRRQTSRRGRRLISHHRRNP